MADTYAIFGHPVEHSLSPKIHELFAKQTQQKMDYVRIDPTHENFESALQKFIDAGGKGCNISFPFKHRSFLCAHETSHATSLAQAASGLHIRDDRTIFAENYDGAGLIQDLVHNYHYSLPQKKILLLGAGGAARGIVGPLLAMRPKEVIVANRNAQRAIVLADAFQSYGKISGLGLENLENISFDLIIHATTIGHEKKILPLPSALLTANTWCYDLSYGDAALPFLHWATQHGAKKTIDGLGMLVEHNAALFFLWRHIYPDTQPIIKTLRRMN